MSAIAIDATEVEELAASQTLELRDESSGRVGVGVSQVEYDLLVRRGDPEYWRRFEQAVGETSAAEPDRIEAQGNGYTQEEANAILVPLWTTRRSSCLGRSNRSGPSSNPRPTGRSGWTPSRRFTTRPWRTC